MRDLHQVYAAPKKILPDYAYISQIGQEYFIFLPLFKINQRYSMIQRIQSIFLLLTATAFGLLFIWPFAISDKTDNNLFADSLYNVQDHILLIIMAALGGAAALLAIFTFRNRKAQAKLTYLPIILSILIPVMVLIFFTNQSGSSVVQAEDIEDQIGLYLPAFALIFGILALRSINKDEKTVRSMDRLR